jgi:spermidine synthase
MSRSRDGLLLVAALASGAAALAYEMLWTRLLALSLGSEIVGILATLAGYFGGMALGAAVLHDRAVRAANPARLFVALELAAAVFALVSPFLLVALARVLPRWLGPLATDGGTAALAASTAVAALVLVLGAAPLGASLAALVEARRRACPEDHAGRGLGRIYGANILGASLGALTSVHLLFPALGYAWGAVASGCLGIAAAAAAARWSRDHDLTRSSATAPPVAVDTSRDPDPDMLRETWLLHLLSFGLGAAGIGLQVVGVRILGQHLENTIFTFVHMLAVYLAASATGAYVYQRLAARAVAGRPATVLLALLWLLAALIVLAAIVLHNGPALLATLAPEGASLAQAFLAELALAFVVFVPSALAMGAALSHVIGLVSAGGRGVGRVYALNALGCATAPFLFGLYAIPRLGYSDSLYLVVYLYLGLFGLFGWYRRFSPVVLIAGVLVGVALTAAGPRSLALVETDDGWTRLEQRETLHGLVAVSELKNNPTPGATGPLRRLQVGKRFRMGGAAAFGERRMGQLCALLSQASGPPGPVPRALYLGLGTGSTMGGALQVPHAAAEGVELVPEIVQLLPLFSKINDDLATRPGVSLHAADARRYLAASDTTYDLVVADLFHPGQDGASALFSREHFRAARDHLRPGGLMCQWLPLYQLDAADVQAVARSFLDVFPETHAFLGIYNAQNPALALVGRAPDPAVATLQLDAARLSETTKSLQTIVDPRDLLASHLLGPAELAAWAGDGPRNTDLDPIITFNAARVAYRDDRELGARNLALLLDHAVPAPRSLLTGDGADTLAKAAVPHPDAARHYLRGELARAGATDVSTMSQETAEHYLRSYESDPAFAPTRGALYTLVAKNERLAEPILKRMLARTPDEPRVYEAYLNYLRPRDPAAFEQLMREAQEKFPRPAGP